MENKKLRPAGRHPRRASQPDRPNYPQLVIAIMTVTGLDHTGIIAGVSTRLAELDVNITNVSQTIMGDWFTMIVQCEFDESQRTVEQLQEAMRPVEEEQKLSIKLQSEAIFRAMHEL